MSAFSLSCLNCRKGFGEENEEVMNFYGEPSGIGMCCAPKREECSHYGYWKTEDEFYFSRGKLTSQCKQCQIAKNKQYYKHNRETCLAKAKQYRDDHLDEARQYRVDHRERINELARERYATEEGKLKGDTRRLLRALYRGELTPERLKEAERLVGCTRAQYCKHINRQFKPGMSESNYGQGEGTWSQDHVIPFHAFQGELKKHLRILCWHKNVQPLWQPEQNVKAGSRFKESEKQDLIKRYNATVNTTVNAHKKKKSRKRKREAGASVE